MNFFRFTLDIGEDFVDGKLPTLDVKIQHEYEYMEEDDHGEGQLVWRQERERTDWYQPWSRQEDETIPEGWKRCERSEDLYCDVCPLELRGDTDQYVKGEGGHHGQDDKVLSQVPGGRRSEAEEHVNHWPGSRSPLWKRWLYALTGSKTARGNPSSTSPNASSATKTRMLGSQDPANRKPGRGYTLEKVPDPCMRGAKNTIRMHRTLVGGPT